MKKSFLPFIFFYCISLLTIGTTAAQPNTTKTIDSINAKLLLDYNKKMIEVDQQRILDSIKKEELQKELNLLKTSNSFKKEELKRQLVELSTKEAQRLAEQKQKIDSFKTTAKLFAVNGFFNDTLFLIFNRLGSFSAQDRAVAIEKRIKALADNYYFKPDSLKVEDAETTADVVFGELIIVSVSANDALWNNSSKTELANTYKDIIGNAIMLYKAETSFSNLAREIGLAALVLAATILVVFYLIKLFKLIANRITRHEGERIREIKLKEYTLLDSKSQVKALLLVVKFFKWFLIFMSIYIALPILFRIFPWTINFADTLFGWFLTPLKKIGNGLWNYFPNLITIIVIVFVFRYVLKAISFFKKEIETGNLHLAGFYPDWANPTYHIVKVIAYAFMAIIIFPYLPGSDSPIFKGVSVFLGVLFTFGSAGSLSNVVAGLVLTYMRLFKIGDRVKVGEVTGDVIEKSLLVTRIRTIKNEVISIPNLTVMSGHTINYSSDVYEKGLILHTTVTIGYDVPWKNMHEVLLNAANRTAMLLKDPIPFVLQTSLEDFYVSYQINAYTTEANRQATIYSELHQNIQDCCKEAGIEILSPHYRAARDGNATTIPASYLDMNYNAPAFKVNIESDTDRL